MSLQYGNGTQNNSLLDSLIQTNGQAVETREQMPYAPVIYAIPEEWRLAEKQLLEQAVRFQPELYRQISRLVTRQELEELLEEHMEQMREIRRDMLGTINSTLRQDGSVREQNFSRTSDLLSSNSREWQRMMERLEDRIRKIMIGTAVASVSLSVLVCTVLLLLVR